MQEYKVLKTPYLGMGFKDIKYNIPVAHVAHGTWHVFPFNWSPNPGQFVDVASWGPLFTIFVYALV